MKAMILAAGRGERMRPLTDHLPKPLLTVNGVPLIQYHIEKLANIGVKDIVINIAWLAEKLVEYMQDGRQFGVNIHYSKESGRALETAGGIIKALPLLAECDDPFLVVNGDIFIDYDFSSLPTLTENQTAHLWLTQNPLHNTNGDFSLIDGLVRDASNSSTNYTFCGIGLYRPSFFESYLNCKVMPLAPLIRDAISENRVAGSILQGKWTDVGTPERLERLEQEIQALKNENMG